MKVAIANSNDLIAPGTNTINMRGCLSATRAVGFCFNCRNYPKCESRIPSAELESLQHDLDTINAQAAAKREEMARAGAERRY